MIYATASKLLPIHCSVGAFVFCYTCVHKSLPVFSCRGFHAFFPVIAFKSTTCVPPPPTPPFPLHTETERTKRRKLNSTREGTNTTSGVHLLLVVNARVGSISKTHHPAYTSFWCLLSSRGKTSVCVDNSPRNCACPPLPFALCRRAGHGAPGMGTARTRLRLGRHEQWS